MTNGVSVFAVAISFVDEFSIPFYPNSQYFI